MRREREQAIAKEENDRKRLEDTITRQDCW